MKNSQEILDIIKEEAPGISLKEILDILEDGSALAALGITDLDIEAVEELHADLSA